MTNTKDIFKDRDAIKKMAEMIFNMEEKYDSSMKGVFLDEFVTEYVSNHGKDFCEMFDFVMQHQSKDSDSYGDFDESVKKLNITGDFNSDKKEYNATAVGMYLRDIFSSNDFVIIKVTKSHKELERFTETEYHCRKIFKEIKGSKIDFKKYVKYGDFRDDGYTVTFRIPYLNQPLEVKDKRGMIMFYSKFNEALRALRNVHHQLKEK